MLLVSASGTGAIRAVLHVAVPAIAIPSRLVPRGLIVRVGDRGQLVVVVHGLSLGTLFGCPTVCLVNVIKRRVAVLTLVGVVVARAISGRPWVSRAVRRVEVLR